FIPSRGPAPTAAATRRRAFLSLHEFGNLLNFSMSFTVISPMQILFCYGTFLVFVKSFPPLCLLSLVRDNGRFLLKHLRLICAWLSPFYSV
ncbi:hypothetical protein, partial [Anaplasma phagocytophilum]|uniref:hypothetical protein n=1 Tax=Anaplasma phagocytophilum TaxID=948 RepID=UPI00201A4A2B